MNSIVTTTIDHLPSSSWQLRCSACRIQEASTRTMHSGSEPGHFCLRIFFQPRNTEVSGKGESRIVLHQMNKWNRVGLPIPVPPMSCASGKQHAGERCRVESRSLWLLGSPIQYSLDTFQLDVAAVTVTAEICTPSVRVEMSAVTVTLHILRKLPVDKSRNR